MKWFSEHSLNSTHWIYIRLVEDAPRDRIHRHLTLIFDIGVRDTINLKLGDEIDFSACPGDWSVDKVTQAPHGVLFCLYTKDMNNTTKDMNNTPSNNPYVNNLVAMGYDRADCEMVAAAGQEKTFPCVIHGRTFDTKDQYDQELHDYINGLWHFAKCPPFFYYPIAQSQCH